MFKLTSITAADLMKYREIHKVVVMGAGGVGKTSILLQFMEGMFVSQYKPTVEDYYRHTIQLTDGVFQTVEILDTAGTHYFPAMRELNIRGGRGFVLVFSVDSLSSFLETIHLYEQIVRIKGTNQVPIVLVGNKSDLKSQRQVPLELVLTRKQTDMDNCPYIETSAKYNCNVAQLFLQLLQLAKRQHIDHPIADLRKSKLLSMRRFSSSFGSLPNLSMLRRRSTQQSEKSICLLSTTNSKPAPTSRRLLELQFRNSSTSSSGTATPGSPGSFSSGCSIGSSISSASSASFCSSSQSVSSAAGSIVCSSNSSGCGSSAGSSVCGSPVSVPRKPHLRLQAVRASSDACDLTGSRQGNKSPLVGRKLLQHLVKPQLSLDETRFGLSSKSSSSQSSKSSFDSGLSSTCSGSLQDISLEEQRCALM